jgi:hypothetical protein
VRNPNNPNMTVQLRETEDAVRSMPTRHGGSQWQNVPALELAANDYITCRSTPWI